MSSFLAIVRRELSSYFASLIGYILIACVLFLIGFTITDMLERLNQESTDVPVTEMFYQTWYFWLILLLASPLITMRTFAHEKSSGTFETLMTAPVRDIEVVLAKFASALLFHLLLWMPLFLCVLIVRYYANDTTVFGPPLLASAFLGILLLGGLYMSIGCFASALTRSQIIAAVVAFVLGVGLFLLSFRSLFGIPRLGSSAKILGYVSMIEHMQDFVRGVLDTRHVTFYVTLTIFFLFLTLKAVESRRWR